ncbi:MAG: hypothetical protein OXQ94_05800 [Gemmatimonadota bacterium]|nr:hypothetical protein [Gemmatimonadota bacterium]MDE2871185.1 hypothetical protein [Gemmatimonadota bacterium]
MKAKTARVTPVIVLACLAPGACDDPLTTAQVSRIEVVSGDRQRAVQGLSLEEPVVVRVLDVDGLPIPNFEVSFTPPRGHGQLDSASATNGNGEASAFWKLGSTPGDQTLGISAGDADTLVSAVALDLEAELDTLFTPPSQAEIDENTADWAARDFSAADIRVELSEELSLGETPTDLRIVSHVVAGVRHYGAIVVPQGASEESLHVLTYLHGGDGGTSLGDLQFVGDALGELRDSFVYVVPSFRAEPLRHGGRTWMSEGPPSLWDYDVDDAMALVSVAFETTPEAEPGSYSIVGGSRGAGVALLAGARDERVERIVAFFGPTDFFDEWVREIVREAALRMPRELTGVAHLDSTVVQPFIRGELSRADARLELVRRTSVLYAADLPSVQLHHGTLDQVVSVSQAESLIRAMEELGRGPPDFEAYIYEDGGHDFVTLQKAVERAIEFISRVLGG